MKFQHLSILLFSLFIFSCNAPDYPEFKEIRNVKFKSLGFLNGLSVTFKGDAVFNNPNPIGANVTQINLDVMVDDKKVTTIKQDVSATMPANADFTLPLNFDIPLKEVYKDIKPSLGNLLKNRTIKYRVEGTLKVGLGKVEVAVPVEFEEEEEIRI